MAKPVLVDIDFGGSGKVTGLTAPTNPTDAATKAYVDAIGGGPPPETNPQFAYSSGRLVTKTYASGNTKTYTYNPSGQLTQIDYEVGATIYRDTFIYNPDGSLAEIEQTVI
jgi:YD repeat-containing protein